MCGRATVSTDVGGVAEAVGDAGLVVPPRDPRAFATACLELLTEPARRAELAAPGPAAGAGRVHPGPLPGTRTAGTTPRSRRRASRRGR